MLVPFALWRVAVGFTFGPVALLMLIMVMIYSREGSACGAF